MFFARLTAAAAGSFFFTASSFLSRRRRRRRLPKSRTFESLWAQKMHTRDSKLRYSLEGGGERKNESDTFLPPSHLERKGAYFYSARLQSRCKHERMGKVQNTHSMFAKLQICREEERGFLQVVHTLSVTLLPPTEKGFFLHTRAAAAESPELGVVLKARQKPLDEGRGAVCVFRTPPPPRPQRCITAS